MSVLVSILSNLSKLAILLLLIAIVPGLPPHGQFEAFSVSPCVPLTGALAVNTKLNSAERLMDGEIYGPENLHVHDGQLYTTLNGGFVAKLVGDKLEPIIKFGKDCEGFHDEDKCGRPLGLAFDKKGKMYVADAYYGIFKVDLATGKSENLISTNDTIEGRKPMFPNSLVVDSNDVVYWTDSSTHSLHDTLLTVLDSGSGRLLKYDPVTRQSSVLLDKLHFANGVALSDDDSFVVVAETVAHRVLKYHLKGPKAGKREVFIDGLPGAPDNIHSDGKGGFYVTLVIPRDPEHQSVLAYLAPYPLVRKLILRLVFLVKWSVMLLRDLYPVDQLKKAAHIIGHFELLPAPPVNRTSVLFLTRDGKVSSSLHATDGLTGISDFVEHNGFFYLGSPFNTFLARVKAS